MRTLKTEQGSSLVIVLLLLSLLSIIAVFASNTSITETRIAANEKAYNTVFYEAEAGIPPGVRVLLDIFDKRSVGTYNSLQWTPDTLVSDYNRLIDEIIGSSTSTNGRGFSFRTPADDPSDHRGIQTEVRLQRQMATSNNTGGSTEFATGHEGLGYGSSGGVHIYYFIRPTATGPSQSSVTVEAKYRKVTEIGEGR